MSAHSCDTVYGPGPTPRCHECGAMYGNHSLNCKVAHPVLTTEQFSGLVSAVNMAHREEQGHKPMSAESKLDELLDAERWLKFEGNMEAHGFASLDLLNNAKAELAALREREAAWGMQYARADHAEDVARAANARATAAEQRVAELQARVELVEGWSHGFEEQARERARKLGEQRVRAERAEARVRELEIAMMPHDSENESEIAALRSRVEELEAKPATEFSELHRTIASCRSERDEARARCAVLEAALREVREILRNDYNALGCSDGIAKIDRALAGTTTDATPKSKEDAYAANLIAAASPFPLPCGHRPQYWERPNGWRGPEQEMQFNARWIEKHAEKCPLAHRASGTTTDATERTGP